MLYTLPAARTHYCTPLLIMLDLAAGGGDGGDAGGGGAGDGGENQYANSYVSYWPTRERPIQVAMVMVRVKMMMMVS